MIRQREPSIAERAKRIYEDRLKSQLEPKFRDQFVAIEPESGDYFLGNTLSDAIGESRKKYPNRLVHTLRIGHKAAVHFGMHLQ